MVKWEYSCGLSDDQTHILHIPKNVRVGKPIRLEFTLAASHLRIVLEEGAQAQVSETLAAPGSVSRHFEHATEVSLAPRSSLTIVSLQNARAGDVTISQTSRIGDDAKLHWQNVTLGGRDVTHTLLSRVEGAHARSSIDWILHASGRAHCRIEAENVFAARGGEGEITLKGVARERAHVRMNGKIVIGEGGAGTETFLTARALMLDETARVDAVPALEIKTNDVRASHSASVSRISPEDFFTFAARGISEKEARRMLVLGFLGEIVERIADEGIRNEVLTAIGNM